MAAIKKVRKNVQETRREKIQKDGRKNQNETGIDCGGPCSDCGKLKYALTLL